MIQFGIITDIQYADKDPQDKRIYRDSIEKFLTAAGTFRERKTPFIFQLGDPVEEGWNNLTCMAELFQRSNLKFRNVLGNHDFNIERDHKEDVYRILKVAKPGYYSFIPKDSDIPKDSEQSTNNRWRFIILFGLELGYPTAMSKKEEENVRKLQEQYRLKTGKLPFSWNGCLSKKQLQWFEKELTEADRLQEKVLVFSHFPLFSYARTVEGFPNLGSVGNMGIYFSKLGVSTWNGMDVLDIMDRHMSVKAYFAGHLHEGGFGTRKNVHHVTFKGVVESKNAYAIVTLEENMIRIEGFGEEPSRTLKI